MYAYGSFFCVWDTNDFEFLRVCEFTERRLFKYLFRIRALGLFFSLSHRFLIESLIYFKNKHTLDIMIIMKRSLCPSLSIHSSPRLSLIKKTTYNLQGQTLQNYNNELVKCIEDLREKREEVNRQILKEEEEKAKIQKDLSILTDRLQKLNESLTRKQQARNEYDKTIQETEAAYMKILESSQTLLHVLKRESVNLTKRRQASS